MPASERGAGLAMVFLAGVGGNELNLTAGGGAAPGPAQHHRPGRQLIDGQDRGFLGSSLNLVHTIMATGQDI